MKKKPLAKKTRKSSPSPAPVGAPACDNEKGIYRHDYGNTHGYRAYIKFRGKEYQKIFSDKGNPALALKKARHWRKLQVKTLQESSLGESPLKKTYSNNKSGITGVFRSVGNWQAAWVEKGVHRNSKFPIAAHGERQAKRLACQARAAAEERLYGAVMQPKLKRYATQAV